MTTMTLADLDARAVRLVRRRAHKLSGRSDDFDALLERVGDAHLVPLGGASHGTHEFYRIRAEITKRLIREKGYYRTMVRGGPASWNLRDQRMADTLYALLAFHGANDSGATRPKLVGWSHDSHIGSARWTEMSSMGELNLGQLVREKHGKAAVLVGFTTYLGTVTAASQWNGVAERKVVHPALPGSYETVFHSTTQPKTERLSHYLMARLPRPFDAVIHYATV